MPVERYAPRNGHCVAQAARATSADDRNIADVFTPERASAAGLKKGLATDIVHTLSWHRGQDYGDELPALVTIQDILNTGAAQLQLYPRIGPRVTEAIRKMLDLEGIVLPD